jgi:ATP-dependent RNA helicase RhlB
MKFASLHLHSQLLEAIKALGFTEATPIQGAILPLTLLGRDAIGRAQTGTGKTAAFLITVIQDLLVNPVGEERFGGEPRALILAPTRELAQQIHADAMGLIEGTGLRSVCLLGGADLQGQVTELESSLVDIVVATPGRLIDMMNRKHVWLDRIELFVLDEADRMMDMGFIPDIKRIINSMPDKSDRQSLLFSATFNQDVMNLAYQWLYEPEYVEVEPEQKTAALIDQQVYLIAQSEKLGFLQQFLRGDNYDKVIVFANRRDQVRDLYLKLKQEGFAVAMLSGEMSQDKRESHLERFKQGEARVMVATDVAGRGIHVDDISHVINYTLPDQVDDYVHRIGRTGRAGASGISIALADEDDSFMLPALQKHFGADALTMIQP